MKNMNINATENTSIIDKAKILANAIKIEVAFKTQRALLSKLEKGIDNKDIIDIKAAVKVFNNAKNNYYFSIVEDYDSQLRGHIYTMYRDRAIDHNTLGAITIPLDPSIPETKGFNGMVVFSLVRINNLLNLIKDQIKTDYERSLAIMRIVAHECRHVQQYEYFRDRGGISLIAEVTNKLQFIPYEENILEKDAIQYQIMFNDIPFDKVFKDFI